MQQSRNREECPRPVPYPIGTLSAEVTYPVLNLNWRIPGPTCPLAEDYIRSANVEFTTKPVQAVETQGNRIVMGMWRCEDGGSKGEGDRNAETDPQVSAAAPLLKNRPQMRDQIAQIHTIGAIPHIRGPPPDAPMPSGLPYGPTRTAGTIAKIRKGVKEERAPEIASHVDGESPPSIAKPTTTAKNARMAELCRRVLELSLICAMEIDSV